MKQAELRALESFAANRVSVHGGYTVLWPKASLHAAKLLHLIARYEMLPRSHRRFHFALSPNAILVSRF